MSGFTSLFSGKSFKSTVKRYCDEIGWKIADLNDRRAVIQFEMESGRTQTLYIIRHDTTLEFSVPSEVSFDSFDEIPDELSSVLMQRNRIRRFGFWCIEVIDNMHVYSVMHNAEMSLMSTEYFAGIVQSLINECDEFELAMLEMLEEVNVHREISDDSIDWDQVIKFGLGVLLTALVGGNSDS